MAQRNFFTSRLTLVAATALALSTAASGVHAAVEVFTSGATFYKRVVTNTSVNTTASTTFANVPGTLTTVFVPPLTNVLISVDFSAEAGCFAGGAGDPNWCELMVQIGGAEGSPQASTTSLGDTYAFAATDSGKATTASWRGHAMSRHRCIRNASAAPLAVPVAMQWKIVQFGATASSFWLDDSAMVVQMSRDCTVQAVTASPNIGPVTPGSAQSDQR
jgi:hypothetical protein